MTQSDTVTIIGSGPPADAVTAALSDVNISPITRDEPDPDADLTILIASTGASIFPSANKTLTTPWIAVELGGIGGYPHPEIDVTIAPFTPTASCYQCLRTRVAANDPPLDPPAPRTTKPMARLGGAIAGNLATKLLTTDTIPTTITELPYAERPLLPVPTCDCTDSPNPLPEPTHTTTTLDETVSRAERTIDDRIGLIQSITEPHSFPLPYYLATLCTTTEFSDATGPKHAAGAASDWNAAFMKATGEALERYASSTYRTDRLHTEPISTTPNAIPPNRFVQPTPDDTDPDAPITWVQGRDLTTETTVSLPAEFVYFPPPTEHYRPAITTGLGLGTSTTTALLAGLYEVIERDATMLAWYSTYDPLELDITDPAYTELVERALSKHLDVTALLVTQDIDIPVITACVHRTTDWPHFAVGASANLHPVTAAQSALEEALQNWTELNAMGQERAQEEPSEIARYAALPPEANRFITTPQTIDIDTIAATAPPTTKPAELDTLITTVAEAGLTPYASRLTTTDLATTGFEVTRVLIPEAQPLFIDHPYFGERARTVPRQLGFTPKLDRAPHPYP